MHFGGPVWHVSVCNQLTMRPSADLLTIAREELAGVGDPALGEWTEEGSAVHLRRRLTPEEAQAIGPVVDVRGTWEAHKRIERLRRYLPPQLAHLPEEAFP